MFHEKLKFLLNLNHLSYRKLSKATGISEASIGTYARGEREPSLGTLLCLADYFGVTVDSLLRDQIPKEASETESYACALADKFELTDKESAFLTKYLAMPADLRQQYTNLIDGMAYFVVACAPKK